MRILAKIILTLLLILTHTSCENKWPDNGDLDGMWQLMTIERNGEITNSKNDKVYWSVRSNLLQLSQVNGSRMYAHFECHDGMFIVKDLCYLSPNAQPGDNDNWIPSEESHILKPWGICPVTDTNHPERLTQTFRVGMIRSDKMILHADEYILTFRKF